MPPFFDQRLSAAHALATACCESSLQPARDVVFRGSVSLALELAPCSLGNNASQVRLLVVPVSFLACLHVCIVSVFITLLQVLGVSISFDFVEALPSGSTLFTVSARV
jgi:hypothetical protein